MQRVLTAIVTPFNHENKIDLYSLIELIRFQLLHNCGVVLFGTTGECPTLSNEERETIMDEVIKIFHSNINDFVIGVGGNNTSECIHNVESAKKRGFSQFMITTPYYNKPTQLGMEKHFEAICNTSKDSKFILYNVPGRTNVNLLPNTVYNICNKCPNVFAIKEASGDLGQMILIRRLCPFLTIYCGDDGLVIPAMSIGAYGVISVLSNYTPKTLNLITKYCTEKNFEEAFLIYKEVDDMIRLLFIETNPVPIKYLLYETKLIDTYEVRLPLVKFQSDENKAKLETCRKKLCKFYLNNPGKY
jgi:4-hydroxy-tetrahydrodipicolinate synthase